MQCGVCKTNSATMHFTHVEGEKMRKLDLCVDCVKAMGIDDPMNMKEADLKKSRGQLREFLKAASEPPPAE